MDKWMRKWIDYVVGKMMAPKDILTFLKFVNMLDYMAKGN